jgi:histone H3/H4
MSSSPIKKQSKSSSTSSKGASPKKKSRSRKRAKDMRRKELILTKMGIKRIIRKAGLHPRVTPGFIEIVNTYFTEALIEPLVIKAAHITKNSGYKTISQKHMGHAISSSQQGMAPRVYM